VPCVIAEVDASTPAVGAGRDLLGSRLGDLARAIRRFNKSPDPLREGSAPGAKRVHELRVACRRTGVALAVLRDFCGSREWARLRKAIRRVRRATGVLRDCDVHAQLIAAVHLHACEGRMPEVVAVLERISRDRAVASNRLQEVLEEFSPARSKRLTRAILNSVQIPAGSGPGSGALISLAASKIRHYIAELRGCSSQDLRVPENLHALRLSLKQVRYATELVLPDLAPTFRTTAYARLEEVQRRFGEANDVSTLVERLDALLAESGQNSGQVADNGLADLRDRFAQVRDRRCEQVAGWWLAFDSEGLFAGLEAAFVEPDAGAGARPDGSDGMVQNNYVNGAPGTPTDEPWSPGPALGQRSLWLSGLRLAVIDLGSNSIRLLAVELVDEHTWKVLAEERAMTRLAQGLGRSGVLCAEAMARSVEAVGRFKSIAEKFGVAGVRAFATAAVREAENRADFLSLVHDRTGLKLDLVSELDEGKLTHRSVARVYDLGVGTGAVVDIGGGSLEVVYSQGGIITGNSSMPLGAVRVTEAFGGADECSGARFKEMRRHIRKLITASVRKPEVPPTIMVGCGGTFTTLLTLGAAARGVMIERNSPALMTLGPVARPQLRSLIRELRGMTLEERLRVPGLPSDRADIVVAGLTVVDELMRHLGAAQINAHPGGVREGLILRLIDEEVNDRSRAGSRHPTSADLLRSVREFASRCRYERAHSEHVAGLALSIYDQFREESDLIPGLGTSPHERAILEAAAVLHDVGMMVEYRAHHKHGFTIIRHADLAGWSGHQVDLVALVARYHRRSEPKARHPEFAALNEHDRNLVRRLAAILRVADGLDRSHTQGVQAARVRFGDRTVHLEVSTGRGDPTTDIQAAQGKGGLLAGLLGVELGIMAVSAGVGSRPELEI